MHRPAHDQHPKTRVLDGGRRGYPRVPLQERADSSLAAEGAGRYSQLRVIGEQHQHAAFIARLVPQLGRRRAIRA